ncbi:uncharacterized protein LOC120413012 [Culex pipiens pallens]|uniref:uncharacterized protein LOC120413012 n=1 Tax=Culex pipiens pallens TaxID=42434 RepID=UPI001954D567|nr:uncharacterized protein LOC120413012 [Culex pipiens pallens]
MGEDVGKHTSREYSKVGRTRQSLGNPVLDNMATQLLNNDLFLNVIRKARNDPSIVLCHGCRLRSDGEHCDRGGFESYKTAIHFRSSRYQQEQAVNLTVKIGAGGSSEEDSQEVRLYGEVLPAMAKVLKEAGIDLQYPRLIHASNKPNTVLILEDIQSLGWMKTNQTFATFEDVLPVIQSIAELHAVSYFLHQTSTDLSCYDASSGIDTSIESKFESISNEIKSWKNCEEIASKFEALKSSSKAKLAQVFAPVPKGTGYNVLNHGNLQRQCLRFKPSAGTMLTDYRCHWGSPAIDLICLLDKIVTPALKATHRREIVYAYYQHFVQILDAIGYLGVVPRLVELQMELLRKGFLEVFHEVERAGTGSDLINGHSEPSGFPGHDHMKHLFHHEFLHKGLLG